MAARKARDLSELGALINSEETVYTPNTILSDDALIPAAEHVAAVYLVPFEPLADRKMPFTAPITDDEFCPNCGEPDCDFDCDGDYDDEDENVSDDEFAGVLLNQLGVNNADLEAEADKLEDLEFDDAVTSGPTLREMYEAGKARLQEEDNEADATLAQILLMGAVVLNVPAPSAKELHEIELNEKYGVSSFTDDADMEFSLQRSINELDIDSREESEVHPDGPASDSFLVDTEINPLEVEPDEDVPFDRAATIAEIREYYKMMGIPKPIEILEMMDDVGLEDLVGMLRKNHGGSIDMASILKRVEIDYARWMDNPLLRRRLDLLSQKQADFVKIIQRLQKTVGRDVVINGIKINEYHEFATAAVRHISVLHEQINAIGEQLKLDIDGNQFKNLPHQTPIVEGIPADPRVAMSVLRVVAATLDRLLHQNTMANDSLERKTAETAYLKTRLDAATKALDEAHQHNRDQHLLHQSYLLHNTYYIIKDSKGNFLRQIDKEAPLTSPNDLDLRGDTFDCLQLDKHSVARTLVDRLHASRRFRKRTLKIYRVSIVEES